MAKKENNTKLYIGAALLAGVAILLLKNKQSQAQPQPYYNYPQIPPAPAAPQTPAWTQWANAIIDTFGNVADLWQPGGPFYNTGNQAEDVIFDDIPGYDNPYDYDNVAGYRSIRVI